MWRKSPALLERAEKDELVVVCLKNGEMFSLTGVTRLVWESLSEKATLETLTKNVCSRYEATASQARADIVELLEEFRSAGLLEEAP